jgi:hypothetical protein
MHNKEPFNTITIYPNIMLLLKISILPCFNSSILYQGTKVQIMEEIGVSLTLPPIEFCSAQSYFMAHIFPTKEWETFLLVT